MERWKKPLQPAHVKFKWYCALCTCTIQILVLGVLCTWYYIDIRVLSQAWHTRYRHIFVSHGRLWKYNNSGGINTDLLYFITNRNMCYFSEWVASTKVRKVLNPQVCCKNYLWSQSKKRIGHIENVLKYTLVQVLE